jgi:hypothetical protein
MNGDDIGRKLDAIAAILKLVNHEELGAARLRIRSDRVYAAILDSARDWAGAATVQAAAAKKGSARSTTSRKIVELIELGLLEKQGGGKSIEYRSTGLV